MGHFFFGPSKRGGLSNFPLHIRSGLSSFLMLGGGGKLSTFQPVFWGQSVCFIPKGRG